MNIAGFGGNVGVNPEKMLTDDEGEESAEDEHKEKRVFSQKRSMYQFLNTMVF